MASLRTIRTLKILTLPLIPDASQSPESPRDPLISETISELPTIVRRNVGRLPSLDNSNTDRLTQQLGEVFLALENIRAEQSREKEFQKQIRERDQNAVIAKLVSLGTQLNSLNERVKQRRLLQVQ